MQPILKQNLAKKQHLFDIAKTSMHLSLFYVPHWWCEMFYWLLQGILVEYCANIKGYRFIILLWDRFIFGIISTNRILFGRETLVYEFEIRYCFRRMHINLYMEDIKYWYTKDLFSHILEKLCLSRIIKVEKSTLQTGRKYQTVHILPKTFNLYDMFQ